jgi:hypothetical protein
MSVRPSTTTERPKVGSAKRSTRRASPARKVVKYGGEALGRINDQDGAAESGPATYLPEVIVVEGISDDSPYVWVSDERIPDRKILH